MPVGRIDDAVGGYAVDPPPALPQEPSCGIVIIAFGEGAFDALGKLADIEEAPVAVARRLVIDVGGGFAHSGRARAGLDRLALHPPHAVIVERRLLGPGVGLLSEVTGIVILIGPVAEIGIIDNRAPGEPVI